MIWFLSCVCITEKPGVCPSNNRVTICVVSENHCFHDGDCPNDEKCCSYGCGRQCMDLSIGMLYKCTGHIFLHYSDRVIR